MKDRFAAAARVVERYAIGGAVGATIYLEPAATFDVDVFVVFKGQGNTMLLTLEPLYDYLKALCTQQFLDRP